MHTLGQLFIAVLVIGGPLFLLLGQIARVREAGGPRPAKAGSAKALRASAPASARKTAGRAAGRSAMAFTAHPGNRQIRAQARADAHLLWQGAIATNWLEQQRHARQNGTATPGPVTGGGTTAATGPTIRQRLPLGGQPPPPRTGTAPGPVNGTTPGTGSGGPPARRPPSPAPPQPVSSNGGTPVTAGTSTASAEKLIEGINEIHAHAAAGGINAKREAVKAIHEGFVRFGAMLSMLSRQMSEPGQNYGHEITEPLAQAGTHAQAGAMSASESDAALSTLINMTVGDLAASPRQAPHNAELSETGAR